ncbi:MAG TPA: proline--tRNA ligase, partial [bacterium]|nr:proline--tRNA ligase [bacterium]
MRYSRFFLPTLKEVPKEAEIPSHRLMLRAGMIRKLSSGIYEWLPMGLRVLRKAEGIVRREMDRIGGQEVLLPALQPCSLWDETGRWGLYGKELFRLKDRKESDFCLGPTHEEVVTDLVRRFLRSWKEMPLLLYQIQTKFRDEIRPRFGILRGREFLMKDAYSFDRDEEDAGKSYWRAYEAYSRICRACGLDFRAVEASTGLIGGRFSHEFMILASTGEEEIAVCSCGYAANLEKVEFSPVLPDYSGETAQSPEEVSTPGKKTVEEVSQFLGAEKGRFIKTLVYRKAKELFLVLIPGDREVNSKKLEEFVQGEAVLADEAAIFELTGAPSGFAGPVGLKKKAKIIADESIAGMRNAVSGANKKDFHLKNINAGRDFQPDVTLNIIRPAKGDRCLKCGGGIELMRGIEIGHTFKLGTKYSVPMNLKYRDQAGAENPVVMGCYG